MLNEIDFSDPSFVMNRFLSLEKHVAALEAEVASLRNNQQPQGEICPHYAEEWVGSMSDSTIYVCNCRGKLSPVR